MVKVRVLARHKTVANANPQGFSVSPEDILLIQIDYYWYFEYNKLAESRGRFYP